jgi:hypothetical protein
LPGMAKDSQTPGRLDRRAAGEHGEGAAKRTVPVRLGRQVQEVLRTMTDPLILACVKSAARLTEGELRYQLGKRGHPLAQSDRLLAVLAEMEREGLVRTELVVSLVANS